MGKQIDAKSAILIVFVILLLAGAGYLTILIQDGSNPLGIFLSQASEEDGFIEDPEFLAQAGPTPTIAYNSTSPTVTPLPQSPTPTLILPTITAGFATSVPSPLPTALPTVPTVPTELPVAGFGDFLQPVALGGALLVIISLIL